jgi:flagellin
MAISINTNMAATRASHFLASNHANLQKSLDRLSSGKRITQPADDAGGLAVAMKLEHETKVLRGASYNVSNAISLLQVQDGILNSAGDIVSRMGELKSMSQDVTKNSDDIANYDTEFADLQQQLHALSQTKFNGVDLFTVDATSDGSTDETTDSFERETAVGSGVYVKNQPVDTNVIGAGGTQIAISKALLLPALTVKVTYTAGAYTSIDSSVEWASDATGVDDSAATPLTENATLAVANAADANAATLSMFNSNVFTKVLENVATMRATNGGEVKRLQYEHANIETQITNLTAANGRIMDVDIASESSNLAKQQILVQASAAMTAQANTSNDVALMLLR